MIWKIFLHESFVPVSLKKEQKVIKQGIEHFHDTCRIDNEVCIIIQIVNSWGSKSLLPLVKSVVHKIAADL